MAGRTPHHLDEVFAVVEGGQALRRLDGDISKSWVRSAREFGIDPGSGEAPRILTQRELTAPQEAAELLVAVARPELDQLYTVVKRANYVVLLCDADGVVIEHRGEESEAAHFKY